MKNLQQPESQMQEVLFELINRLYIDRRTMMLSCGVWNLTARIADLRLLGLEIVSNEKTGENKYGREITFVHYSLENKKEAAKVYNKMKETQLTLPGV